MWHVSRYLTRSLGGSFALSHARQQRLALTVAAVALAAAACSASAAGRPTQPPLGSQPTATATGQSPVSSAGPAVTTFVPGAWPTVAELPFASDYRWKQEGPEAIVTADGEPLYTCDPATAIPHLNAVGYQTIRYQRDPATTNAGMSAALLFFPDSTNARHALDQIRSDYAACTATPVRDTVTGETLAIHVTQTEDGDASIAYVHNFRRSNNAPGSPEGVASDSHEYFAQRGNVLSFIHVSGSPTIDTADQDPQILQAMINHLSVYR